jgi:hypothetical protein
MNGQERDRMEHQRALQRWGGKMPEGRTDRVRVPRPVLRFHWLVRDRREKQIHDRRQPMKWV